MKRIVGFFLSLVLLLCCAACGQQTDASSAPISGTEPDISQMRSICELAVMECYYHNVAKYHEKDAVQNLWGLIKKDKHFWIEYSGVVRLGVDASLVTIQVDGTQVTISIPEATVQNCTVDPDSLTSDSFIVAANSANIEADDETRAFAEAQANMMATAAADKVLLANAQQQAKTLLEEYVHNVGRAFGIEYTIRWIEVDASGNPLGTSSADPAPTAEPVD